MESKPDIRRGLMLAVAVHRKRGGERCGHPAPVKNQHAAWPEVQRCSRWPMKPTDRHVCRFIWLIATASAPTPRVFTNVGCWAHVQTPSAVVQIWPPML